MQSDIKKVLVVTLMAIGTLFLSQQAQARTWYNFPDYSKIKVDKGADGQYWFYMEFKWNESCPPNFQKDQAIEFEIGIIPKCFLRPRGGKDDKFDCTTVMGFNRFALPNEIIPETGEENCYVDLWNYWNPTASQVKAELHQDCEFDTSGDWCAEMATNSGGLFLYFVLQT